MHFRNISTWFEFNGWLKSLRSLNMLRVVFLTSPKTTRWFTMSGDSEPSLCNPRQITTNLETSLSSSDLHSLGRFWASLLFYSVQSIEKQCPTNSLPTQFFIFDVHFTLEYPMKRTQNWLLRLYFVFSSFQTLSVWYPSALSTDLVRKPLPNRRLKCQTTSTFNNSEFGYKTNCLDDVRSKSDTFSE